MNSAAYAAFRDELLKIARAKEPELTVGQRLRKAGPAIGTALGVSYAVAKKKPLKRWAAPVFAGTSLGWMPDVAASGIEAARGRTL